MTMPAAHATVAPCWPALWQRPLLLWLWCCALGWASLLPSALWAQTTPLQPVPALTARVLDHTATLTAAQRQALEDKLAAFERERGSQVVVLLIATTAPEDIFGYTQRVAEAWKVGRTDVGDGVLLVVAKDDRRLRIATMQAVEGAIPDLAAKRIIDDAITPHFRNGDYAAGLDAGLDHILALLRGENLPPPTHKTTQSPQDDWIFLAFSALFVNLVLRHHRLGRWAPWLATPVVSALGWYFTDSLWRTLLVAVLTLGIGLLLAHFKPRRSATRHRGRHDDWPGGGWGGSGGGTGPGSGGGFSSGGGGRSGGGGASGGW